MSPLRGHSIRPEVSSQAQSWDDFLNKIVSLLLDCSSQSEGSPCVPSEIKEESNKYRRRRRGSPTAELRLGGGGVRRRAGHPPLGTPETPQRGAQTPQPRAETPQRRAQTPQRRAQTGEAGSAQVCPCPADRRCNGHITVGPGGTAPARPRMEKGPRPPCGLRARHVKLAPTVRKSGLRSRDILQNGSSAV